MTTPLRPRIVVATQEPFGYKNFTPTLRHYVNQLGDVVHLIPELPQREGQPPRYAPKPPKGHLKTTNDIKAIDKASIVLIVGGVLSAWTQAVGRRANRSNVPVIFLEAEYPAISGVHRRLDGVEIKGTVVSSEATQLILGSYFDLPASKTQIVGLPLVDDLPRWNPTETARRVVIATSVSSEMPDDGQALMDVAETLYDEGWDIIVSLNPKEDRSFWSRYEISTKSAIFTAAESDVVVTYPSPILVPLNVMRIPTVTMLFDERYLRIVPKSIIALGEPAFDIEDTIKMVDDMSNLSFNDAEKPTQTVSERVVRTIYPYVRKPVRRRRKTS
jgi:hypothetical protein